MKISNFPQALGVKQTRLNEVQNKTSSSQINEGFSKNSAFALKSIAFSGQGILDRPDFIEEDKQVFVRNLFNTKKDRDVYNSDKNTIPQIIIDSFKRDNEKEILVTLVPKNKKTGEFEDPTMPIRMTKDIKAKTLPRAVFKAGKFAPTLELVDGDLNMKIKLLPGSRIKGKGFEVVMPGKVETMGKTTQEIAFKGKKGNKETQIVTYNMEPGVKEAVDLYFEKGLGKDIEPGDYAKLVKKAAPTAMILAGGFGTRLFDHTGAHISKPACKLPGADKSYRMIGNALDNLIQAGLLSKKGKNIKYLSGANAISGDNVVQVTQETNLGDGGCIAKSVRLGHTRDDKPLVILNADNMTGVDLSRAYKEFHEHDDAAILIPYYPVPEDRASSFGLISGKPIKGENVSEIKEFVEKPKNPAKEASGARSGDMYMANPGIYLLSPEVLQSMEKLVGKKLDKGEEIGLANDIVKPIVEMCRKGKLKKADGTPMKVYTVPMEAKSGRPTYWDDLGTTPALVNTTRNMASETSKHGADSPNNLFYGIQPHVLEGAKKAVDLKTGVIKMTTTEEADVKLEAFIKKYGITELEGNAIVYNSAAS